MALLPGGPACTACFYYLVLQQVSVVSQCVCLNSAPEGLSRCGEGPNYLSDLLLSITFLDGHVYGALLHSC